MQKFTVRLINNTLHRNLRIINVVCIYVEYLINCFIAAGQQQNHCNTKITKAASGLDFGHSPLCFSTSFVDGLRLL